MWSLQIPHDLSLLWIWNQLKDVITRGITDSEIQLDLEGKMNQAVILESVFLLIETKRAKKPSASRLLKLLGELRVTTIDGKTTKFLNIK